MSKLNSTPYQPHYWPAWMLLGCLWLIAHLPIFLRLFFGKCLGKICHFFLTSAKQITEVNLKLCFPELTHKQRLQLEKKNFESLGIALIETVMALFLPRKKLESLYQIHGLEHAETAFKKGKGIILMTPHFTCVEIAARLIGMHDNFGVMYRPHKKKFIAYIHERFRKRHFKTYIPNNQVRKLFGALKQNKAIWYAFDIDAGMKTSVFAPFFGIPTATLNTVSRIAKLTHAAVIPMTYHRRKNGLGYDIILSPPLDHFPSGDLLVDATRLNSILEETIRQKPEQYVWQYKRFKTRPDRKEKRFYLTPASSPLSQK